ncbi:unnamed protein product [Dibothriocephalus latus]|uniref:Uncharacterized protein n=1 Tax=Dibothriocephalus latus TaxID=60516 RepID=A0A3P7NG55_DIBLA|nr:unnamed protein product [Dibothriocephalus latus]
MPTEMLNFSNQDATGDGEELDLHLDGTTTPDEPGEGEIESRRRSTAAISSTNAHAEWEAAMNNSPVYQPSVFKDVCVYA